MKDLFSKQSSEYARFRPHYPAPLFDYLASVAPAKKLAWDCGTGNGQAAVALARHFDEVVATDPSSKQLSFAEAHSRVCYQAGGAEKSPCADGSCDLVTAAQAFHWFDQHTFYREARRVLKPGGVVAIWSYNLCELSPEVDAQVQVLYEDILGPYWEPERRQVEEGYSKAAFPFEELKAPAFAMQAEWNFEHLLGYLSTWSSLQTYLKKTPGENPLERQTSALREAWGAVPTRMARWRLALRVGF